MGEIADMMLDGTMCAGCGVWLNDGEDGDGYPGYCSDECARDCGVEPESDHVIDVERPVKLVFCGCGKGFKTHDSRTQHRRATGHKGG